MKCGVAAAIKWNHIIDYKFTNSMKDRTDQPKLSIRNRTTEKDSRRNKWEK